MGDLRHCVIGTAGHVDHGKTALVRALTGVDCDRLEQEKLRGMTIELGFATWNLRADLHTSIVDVPGHERFVHTMVSGAGGLDAVMLVIAADDGVMPQTVEHLRVCELLGVQRGLVVINKADLVDAELLQMVHEDLDNLLQDSFLQNAPRLVCSALHNQGLDALREEIIKLLDNIAPRDDDGSAFLAIDRVFHKSGFGSIVTGTLLSGKLQVGDEVEVLPGRDAQALKLRIRGLQVHSQNIDSARAGLRLAINLRGPEVEQVKRGMAVFSPGWQHASQAVHVELNTLSDAPMIKNGAQYLLHLGTSEQSATLHPLEGTRIKAGERALARLVTEQPLACYAGQGFVLRQPGLHGIGTIGGGQVLDPHPAPGKGSYVRWQQVAQSLQSTSLPEKLLALIADARLDGCSESELAARLPAGSRLGKSLQKLRDRGEILQIAGSEARYVDPTALAQLGHKLIAKIGDFHKKHPVLQGLTASELRGQLPPPQAWLCETALQSLAKKKALVFASGLYRLPNHAASSEDDSLGKIMAIYQKAALISPALTELQQELGLAERPMRDAIKTLLHQQKLVRLADGMYCDRAALDAIAEDVRHFLQKNASLKPSDLKAMRAGLSRKYAIPVLEWLDASRITMRKGDGRVLR